MTSTAPQVNLAKPPSMFYANGAVYFSPDYRHRLLAEDERKAARSHARFEMSMARYRDDCDGSDLDAMRVVLQRQTDRSIAQAAG